MLSESERQARNAYQRAYAAAHKDQIKAIKKKWRDTHKDQINAYYRAWYQRRKVADQTEIQTDPAADQTI